MVIVSHDEIFQSIPSELETVWDHGWLLTCCVQNTEVHLNNRSLHVLLSASQIDLLVSDGHSEQGHVLLLLTRWRYKCQSLPDALMCISCNILIFSSCRVSMLLLLVLLSSLISLMESKLWLMKQYPTYPTTLASAASTDTRCWTSTVPQEKRYGCHGFIQRVWSLMTDPW